MSCSPECTSYFYIRETTDPPTEPHAHTLHLSSQSMPIEGDLGRAVSGDDEL